MKISKITNTNDDVTPVREWLRLLRRNQFFVVEHQLRLGFPGFALKKKTHMNNNQANGM